MIDRDQVVRETLARLPPERVQRRVRALADAQALLRDKLGVLSETDLRRVMELFNQDVSLSHGGEVQGRFAGGLVGRNANLLVGSLDNVNEVVPLLWRADDAWLIENLAGLRRGGRLPGGGWLFLTMVLHARNPVRFLPGSYTLMQGLAALEGVPARKFNSGADYLDYCNRVRALLAAHEIPLYGADVLLINGLRLRLTTSDADGEDEDDEAPEVVPEPARPQASTPAMARPPLTPPPPSIHPPGILIPTPDDASGRVIHSPVSRPPTPAMIHERVAEAIKKVAQPSAPTDVRVTTTTPAATSATFNWLHLTDLHQGMGGASWLWPNVKAKLFADLEKLHASSGPWDVVFFTGDLTQRGTREEFEQLDKTLEQLWARLEKLGSRPQLIAVPGNHDLERPQDRFDPVVLALRQWHHEPRLRDHVFASADNPYRASLRRAFAAYGEWSARGRWSSASRREGALPGDIAVSLEVRGIKVGVIGLNSAFLQLTDADYTARLDVSAHQLDEVCGHDAPDWLQQHQVNFLLTHHPPAWLEPRARQEFYNEIDTPGRFAAHLYGHMHEGTSTSTSLGGGAHRHALQGASLFGLDEYEAPGGRKTQRIHGYSAGRIEIAGAATTARVQLFPRRMIDNNVTGRRIERDQDNYVLDDRGAIAWEVPVGRRAP